MLLSEEIYNKALSLKDEKPFVMEEHLINFCLSKVRGMVGEDHSNRNVIQIFKCINGSYKEAIRLLEKNDILSLNGNLFKDVVEDMIVDKCGKEIKI